ncbi:MAG TPA: hypothetical protein VNU72_09940 [Puia sp.]|jgi:hypothetical protein|nr:hypothetical protein [Puia sp.]
MKSTIPAIVLILTIGLTNARANGGGDVAVHNIVSDRLPARLLTSIKKNYKDFWITDLYKKTSNGRSSYCITVENADKKITLNATPTTNWSVTRVVSKDDVVPSTPTGKICSK